MSCDATKCYTTDEWRRHMAQGLEAHAGMISKYGALGYSLGDEVRLQDHLCESPTCVAAFRKWLQGEYKTIGPLNAEWGSDFKAFNEIKPSYTSQAKRQRNYVPSVDYMTHRRDLWVETCKWCHDAILRGDPGARMGYEGARGYERWPELLRFFRIAGPYDWPDNDIVIDQHQPGTIIGNWIGNYGNNIPDERATYVSWRRLLLGCNSQWWWTLRLAFNGDNTPVRRFATNIEAFAEIRAGLGKLIVNSELVHEKIVMPHCPPSEHVAKFYADLTSIQGAKDTARAILHDLCLHHWRIPMDKIVAGELHRGGHKVVLLPYHQAMRQKDAQALRRFVESGGLLIADLRPAVMNQHGRWLNAGLLDDVFGIVRRAIEGSPALRGKPKITAKEGPAAALADLQGELRVDRAVTARPGAEVGGTVEDVPICIFNRVGKGRAVLLNFALDEYRTLRTTGSAGPMQDFFSALFAEAGIKPTVRVTRNGRPMDGLYMPRWRNGSMSVIGLDRNPIDPARDDPAKATIRWPQRGYVYEVRPHRFLGMRDTVETELAVHVPKLFAWLPYEIGDVTIQAPAAARAGTRVPITVGLGAPEGQRAPHVVCLDVYRPDGTWCHYFRERLRLTGPEASTHIALAHNAPAGVWRFRATEVISGKTVEHTFRVEPAALALKR